MLSPTPAIDRSNLHPGTGYLIAPRVPHGLAAVVEGLTREVLRHRPEDIYVFAAHHFEKLLKLREQYHAEDYSAREFNHEFNREFNLWPIKNAETREIEKSSNDGSLEKEILGERRKTSVDAEESTEDMSTDKENCKVSKQACPKGPMTAKRALRRSKDKETMSDVRATKIISQMHGLHGPSKNIQAKDIKQELRKNKLSGEKGKTANGADKAIRGDRRSRTRISKSDKGLEKEIERSIVTTTSTVTTMTTTMSTSRTSTRRPLKKVRRIETETETETEHDTASKGRFENGYEKSNIKSEDLSRNAIARIGSRERRSEAQLSEHSSERKVSSRALSMDRIRAYVLRKFASTASLEVLRSPTYVEQVQEVIDRAAPIIKEKLEEIRRSRGKRSKSVDLGWNDESFQRNNREDRKRDNGDEEEESRGIRNGRTEHEETDNSLGKNEMILKKQEKKQRRASVRSGKRSRRRENDDFEIDDSSKHSGKSEYESDEPHDTLEARLTATQNILEGISKSTSELGGKVESGETLESETTDHVNMVSLPIVRPPSAKNSKSSTKNGNLTLPPISPEVPKSTKKKDELSLPILSANGNHSTVKSPEQEASKDVEEASTMCDLTSDIEDIAILPEDDHVSLDVKQDPENMDLIPDIRTFVNEEIDERDNKINKILGEDILEKDAERRESLKEFKELGELERGKEIVEDIFKDSLNVTPEILDVPLRPDSLEPNEDEVKVEDNNTDRDNRFDGLKDKLMEIEIAERNIEKALAGQQIATCDSDKTTSQAEKSMTDAGINEAGMLPDEVEETVSKIKKSIDKTKMSNKDEKEEDNDKENNKLTSKPGKIENITETSDDKMENLSSKAEKSIDIVENMKDNTETKETENSRITKINEVEKIVEKSINETEKETVETLNKIDTTEKSASKTESTKNEMLETKLDTVMNQAERSPKVTEKEMSEKKKSINENERSINENLLNNDIEKDVEESVVKVHVKDAQSVNARSDKDNQITKAVISEAKDDNNVMDSKSEAEMANKLSDSVVSKSVAVKDKTPGILGESSVDEIREKKQETDKSPTTSPLSAEVPYAYVLSEGSPCEIPDSVTTVIIPDRPCLSPVTLEDENYQLESTSQKKESISRSDIVKENKTQEENRNDYGMEVFGEYIRPEITSPPADIDFVRGMKGAKLSQDIVIVHQDLDKIKEEGEEEEEKENEERIEGRKEANDQKKNDGKQEVTRAEETLKLAGTLENIMEHEENEGINAESKDAEKIISVDVPASESLPDSTELIDTGVIDNAKTDEPKSTLENSSEESGSTRDNGTTVSSDVKESTVSNRSVESSSLGRPVVPELNLDSLQDNTVSSFKMTANGTTKEDNGSPRESDATTSLIEPLTSDERLMNRPTMIDHEEEVPVEQDDLSRDLQSIGEADQLYPAEHAEYVWLEKDPLSSETMLEDEAKSQEDSIGSMALPEDIVQVGPLLLQKEEEEKLNSEEEIARELIGSLNEETELRATKLDSKEESKDSGESVKSNLAGDDKMSQTLSVPSTSADESKEKECESSLEEFKKLSDKIAKTEMVDKLSHITDKDKEDIKIENSNLVKNIEETMHVAPLAQFEQDELLEPNSKLETANEKIESKNIIDIDSSNNQEEHENEHANVEEAPKNQDKKDTDTSEDFNKNQENKQEKTLAEHEQEKFKLQEGERNIQENLQMHQEIVDTKHDKNILEKEMKDEEKIPEENAKTFSTEEEDTPKSITSARSEQSVEDHSRDGYWTTGTKSSTIETIIETVSPNASTIKKLKTATDASEIDGDKSLSTKKDDSYSTVVKIQACIRGFLARRRIQNLRSKSVTDNLPPAQKIATDNYLTIPQDTAKSKDIRSGRRLRREEALRNTTLSIENAFATGRLQHTSEFHDSVPLPLFDNVTNSELHSTLNESSSKEENVEQAKQSDTVKPNIESDSVSSHTRDNEHARNCSKSTGFNNHSAFPIVMHLMTDTSHNGHFRINQSYDPNFKPTAGTKSMEQAMDILMLGYPRDDDNRYLNFITSVEDVADMNSLDDVIKLPKSTEDAHPSVASGEGSIREPLALPGTPQGIMIEEMTSLDEIAPSDSMKLSMSKASLDTNSTSENCALEDKKNDLGVSPRTVDVTGDRKHTDEEADGQKLGDDDLKSVAKAESQGCDVKDANEKSNGSRDNQIHVDEERNEKT